MSEDKLIEILDFIQKENIVCPMPKYWNRMWQEICEPKPNHNWLLKGDLGVSTYMPLILGGWIAEKKDKHERFLGLIKYFYEKYPEKRILIEELVYGENKWLKWSDYD